MKVKTTLLFSSSCIYLHNALLTHNTHIPSFFRSHFFPLRSLSCIYVYFFFLFFCQIHVFFLFFHAKNRVIRYVIIWCEKKSGMIAHGFQQQWMDFTIIMCLPNIDTWKGVLDIWESLAAWIGNDCGEWAADIGFILNLDLITHHMPVQYIGDGSDRPASLLRIPSHGVIPSLCFRHDNLSIMSNMIENQSNGPSFLPFCLSSLVNTTHTIIQQPMPYIASFFFFILSLSCIIPLMQYL